MIGTVPRDMACLVVENMLDVCQRNYDERVRAFNKKREQLCELCATIKPNEASVTQTAVEIESLLSEMATLVSAVTQYECYVYALSRYRDAIQWRDTTYQEAYTKAWWDCVNHYSALSAKTCIQVQQLLSTVRLILGDCPEKKGEGNADSV